MYSGEDLELSGITEEIGEIVKVGIVSTVDANTCSARVVFPDRDDVVSSDLPIIQRNAGANQDYSLPDVGDNVLCLFLGTGTEDGFILGSFFNQKKTSKINGEDIRGVAFADGTQCTYDRKKKELIINAVGDINVTTKGKISVSSDKDITANSKENIIATAGKQVQIESAQAIVLNSSQKVDITAPAINLNAPAITFGAAGVECKGICAGSFSLQSNNNLSFTAKRIDLGSVQKQ